MKSSLHPLFLNKSSFAIAVPQTQQTITDAISSANKNTTWYNDNNYPLIAQQISEYGISYCQYSYSLPRPMTELFRLQMQVNYTDYFRALGFTETFFDETKNRFHTEKIFNVISQVQQTWKRKYPGLDFNTQNLKFDNLVNFNISFTGELQVLNFETK